MLGGGPGFCSGSTGSASCRGPVKLLGSTRRPLHVLLREKTGTPGEKPRTPPQFQSGSFWIFLFHIWIFFPHLFAPTGTRGSPHSCGVQDLTPQRFASLILLKSSCQQPAMPSGTESPTRRPAAPFTSEPAELRPHMTAGTS